MKNKNLTKASKLKKREWIAQLNNQEPSKQTCTYLKEQSTPKNISIQNPEKENFRNKI